MDYLNERSKNQCPQNNSTKDIRYENLRRSVTLLKNQMIHDQAQHHKHSDQQYTQLLEKFRHQLNIVRNQTYLDISEQHQSVITQILNDMMAVKYQMISDIEHYFDDLFYQLVKNRPSKSLQKKIESQLVTKIEYINSLKETNNYEQIENINLISYLEDIKAKVQEIDETLNRFYYQSNLKEDSNPNGDNDNLKLVINRSIFDKVSKLLPELAYIDINNTQQNQAKDFRLDIAQPSYFQSPQIHEKVLAVINDEKNTLTFFNDGLQQQKTIKLVLKENQKIPYQHSLIVTPNSEIYLSGGVDIQTGMILSCSYQYDPENMTLNQIRNMLVKRIGHQLVYIDNCIYVIGGKTDHELCTKLCERFNIGLNQWQAICSMNYARTRCGITKFNAIDGQTYIYAFFGTDTMKLTNQSIERYSVLLNKWEVVNLKFHMKRLETSGLGCQQINQNEIILFGGFYQEHDRLFKKEQIVFSSKIGIFNTNNYIIKMSNLDIPIDFYNTNSSQCIIQNNRLLIVGHFMQQKSPQLIRCLDVDYVLSIDNEKVQVETILNQVDVSQK